MVIRPRVVDPCECGCKRVTAETDGLTTEYACRDCGAFLADLVVGPEP